MAELLPAILQHAGETLADDGQAHGGWVLRRGDGSALEVGKTLGAQNVLDGEVLQLVPRHTEWPELDYDDIVDVIASGARRVAPGWTTEATRRTGISLAAGAFLVALAVLVLGGGPWREASYVAFGASGLALIVAVTLARVVKDAGAAVPFGVLAMAAGLVGGTLVSLSDAPLAQAGPTQWLTGFGVLAGVGVLAYAGVAHRTHWFVAGIFSGLLGMAGAWLARWDSLGAVEASAIVAALAVVLTPAFPLLSIRLAKLPVPTLPTSTEELLADPPAEPLPRVHATVQRADEILTGLFIATAVAVAACQFVLAASDNTSALWLSWVLAATLMLRARLFPTLRHRVPLLVGAFIGVLAHALVAVTAEPSDRLYLVVPALLLGAVAALAIARYLIQTRPTPYIGRIADMLDVLLIVAIVPVTCLVIGLYGYLRGLFG